MLSISKAVGEQVSRGPHASPLPSPFEEGSRVTVNDFLEALMSDPGPQCILWLPVLHRMATAENAVHHGISCGSCGEKEFRGLRYKSDRSAKYNLCQWCFWRGRIPSDHRDDVFKEYNSFKTPGASGSNSSSRFQCGGGKQKSNFPKYPEVEPQLDLSTMIPPSPLPSIRSNGAETLSEFGRNISPYQSMPLPTRSRSRNDQISTSEELVTGQHPYLDNPYQSVKTPIMGTRPSLGGIDPNTIEDEHGLIARYAQEMHLQGVHGDISQSHIPPQQSAPNIMINNGSMGSLIVGNDPDGRKAIQNSRKLVYDLERKNQEIMHDIERLRKSHQDQKQQATAQSHQNKGQFRGPIMSELQGLRGHRHELECRLDELQGARKDLMTELDELMKLLKVQELHQGRGAVQAQPYLRPSVPNYGELHDAERNNSFTNIAGMGIEQSFPPHTIGEGYDTTGIAFHHDPQNLQATPTYHDQFLLQQHHQPHELYEQPLQQQELARPPVIGSNLPTHQNISSNIPAEDTSQRSSSQQRNRHRSSSATRKKSSASRKRSPSANSNNQKSHISRQLHDETMYSKSDSNEVNRMQSHNLANPISGHS